MNVTLTYTGTTPPGLATTFDPNWRSAHRSQRDYSAEAAGY